MTDVDISSQRDCDIYESAAVSSADDNATIAANPPLKAENEKIEVGVTASEALDSDYPDGGLAAWLTVLGGVCITTATFGFVNSYGVFQAYYSETLFPHISPSTLAWIGSIQYALVFLPGIVTGRLFDLGYFKIPTTIFSCLLVVCTFLTAECKEYWQFLLCQGFAVGLTAGAIFSPAFNCLAHWFYKRRALAYGIVATGSSIGGTVFPILTKNLLPRIGFPWTMRVLGFLILLLVGTSLIVSRRRLPPRDVKGGLLNLAVFKYQPFTIYTIAGFICFLGLYTVLTYIASSANFYGVSPRLAFYLVAIANAASGVGRIACGIMSDRIGPLNSMIPMCFIAAILTMGWPYARSAVSLIIVAIIYGISSGAFVGLLTLPVANMGDIGDVGRRQGMLFTTLSLGAILGPPISGLINTSTGGYTAVGFYAGGAVILAVILMIFTRTLLTGRLWGGIA